MIIIRRNKLTVENSTISQEWDYDKNNGLRPDQFTVGVSKKVW